MNVLKIASLLLAVVPAALAAHSIGSGAAVACDVLSKALPGQVSYPNSSVFITENAYWSDRQAEVHPDCFVAPRNASEVSQAIKVITSLEASFSVKGGGHTAFQGGSNAPNGVTIDLVQLTSLSVSADNTSVSLGAGLRWIDVSKVLDPLGLATVAGRVADVGVSGLILGGGISYFSGQYGWACDNVLNYEVILASGEIVNANPTTNPGLYWALRGGGGSNFGIVTRFDIRAFPQGDLWMNLLVYPGALNATVVPAYVNLTVNGLPADPEAHTFLVNTYNPTLGGFATILYEYHATPPSNANAIPAVFQPFESISPVLDQSTVVANISTLSKAIDEPYGSRQTWWNIAVSASSADLILDIYPLFEQSVTRMLQAANTTGGTVTPYLVFQSIATNVLTAMQQDGGNALGLTPADGPLMIVQLSVTWDKAEMDDVVETSAQAFIEQVDDLAKTKGLNNGFVYMNYGGKTQDVLRSYGNASYSRLEAEAEKWDRDGLLRRLWTGYFKLD